MSEERAFLTAKQAAIYLGYSPGTLRIGRSTGVLAGRDAPKYSKLGKSKTSPVRYEKEALDRWIKEAE